MKPNIPEAIYFINTGQGRLRGTPAKEPRKQRPPARPLF